MLKEESAAFFSGEPQIIMPAKKGYRIMIDKDMKPRYIRDFGCYKDLSNEDYHADKDYISRSSIMDYLRSPFTYWAKHLNPDRPKKDATPQMILGSAFHTLILEPEKFDSIYAIEPKKILLKHVGKTAYDEYKSAIGTIELSKKLVLTYEEHANLLIMKHKLYSNQKAVQLITDARIENSFFWRDHESGLLLKSRPDILHNSICADLKTTSDASPRAFQNEMVKYGYHIQFAMIRDAVKAIEGRVLKTFIDLVIENKYPHNMAIYIIDEEAINEGERIYKSVCLDMKAARELNEWNDYGVQTVGLPKWAFS